MKLTDIAILALGAYVVYQVTRPRDARLTVDALGLTADDFGRPATIDGAHGILI